MAGKLTIIDSTCGKVSNNTCSEIVTVNSDVELENNKETNKTKLVIDLSDIDIFTK